METHKYLVVKVSDVWFEVLMSCVNETTKLIAITRTIDNAILVMNALAEHEARRRNKNG